MDNIKEFLERYFEGQTSVEEEAMLRRFFASGDVPENLKMYKPLFAYFDDEIKVMEVAKGKERSIFSKVRYSGLLWLSGAAACAAILIGTFFFEPQSKKCSGEGDYVIINGRCYTDAKTIRSATLNSLREISGNGDDFAEGNSSEASESYETPEASDTKRIIENQLKEFGSLFDE